MRNEETINVVIGAGQKDKIPAKVCEYSIKQLARNVEVYHTFSLTLPTWHGPMGTDFSFVRFWLPELLAGQKRAIYLDSDMLLFTDIRELWELPMDGKIILRHLNPSVLVVDLEQAATFWKMPEIVRKLELREMSYGRLMGTLAGMPVEHVGFIPDEWNHLDSYSFAKTKLLHYTSIPMQPWRKVGHRHGHLWYKALHEACRLSYVPLSWLKELRQEVVKEAFPNVVEISTADSGTIPMIPEEAK